jgi:2,3-bisphosphoglycerate-independent phosphoglycerate mutase
MTRYADELDTAVAFGEQIVSQTLAEVLSAAGARQLHVAETEKYAHVTFFLNGGREQAFPGERRSLIPSRKDVATYDEHPAMSAYEVASCFVETMRDDPVDLVILNFANPDMVGHTGNLAATVEALEHVDTCLGRVLEVLVSLEAKVMITADHGNAEDMLTADGSANTAHTTNPVPLIVLRDAVSLREGAGLSDLAPTLLCFLGLAVPSEMTGRSLCSCE